MRGEDRLSDLPDHILHHIFSSFATKDLITTTCLLSKKWQHFWVSHPYLDLHIENYNFVDSNSDSNIDDAGSRCSPKFVDKSLYGHSRGGTDLERFSLRWLDCSEGPRLKSWIVKVMNRKVKEVEIVLRLDGTHNSGQSVCERVFGQLSVFNKWEDSRYKFLKGLNGARNLALGTVQ
ncbi:hypothetical protein Sjap_025927 [Stephania japonica]|uniref:F-box domain-containing protein n=1 Tax=Stephania japonica TaxID=461633 RepID=A0AAP0HIE8_9MAGN